MEMLKSSISIPNVYLLRGKEVIFMSGNTNKNIIVNSNGQHATLIRFNNGKNNAVMNEQETKYVFRELNISLCKDRKSVV